MDVLVTGAAGFIGAAVAGFLLDRGDRVVGLDNLNDYYDVGLKEARLARLEGRQGFRFVRGDVADPGAVEAAFDRGPFDVVCHLAAQAGVRYSLQNPLAYGRANLMGFLHILEACRHRGTGNLVYASSSSVYGANEKVPFSETDRVDRPVSLYAATKVANELMAHTYHHLYGIPATGLRFFTVYGPWGRPDMALFKFTQKILTGEPIDVYNHGDMERDFTYIDDIVRGVVAAIDRPLGFEVVNLGNHRPVRLERFIAVLEDALGRKARRNYLPMQPGDVPRTYADVSRAKELWGWEPTTPIEVGIPRFVEWYVGWAASVGHGRSGG
ncbi:NAD-dependent epimerase [Deferrisoma camini]|uniref:NAD-dependent epimerase n=1 Tax=Deferrisoma camini TaxID=1035120 RepID=UPI00046CEDBB|nr:NAD-dependent epimerase [Deferrisoma camini]